MMIFFNKVKYLRWLTMICLLFSLMFILSACGAVIREQPDEYRMKQLLAGSFTLPAELAGQMTGVFETSSDNPRLKRLSLLLAGQKLTQDELNRQPEIARKLAFAWGEGDLKYHIALPGDQNSLVSTSMNATTSAAYNFSYMTNSLTKVIANIRWNFALAESGFSPTNSKKEIGISAIGYDTAMTWSLIDLFHFFWGWVLVSFFIPICLALGLLFHPIQTFVDILPIIPDTIYTIVYAIINFFF